MSIRWVDGEPWVPDWLEETTDEDDGKQLLRGIRWGVLFSVALFWAPLTFLLLRVYG